MEGKWFSTKEVADYLGVKPDKIYRLIKKESLPAQKSGRLWKFRKDEIDNWKEKDKPKETRTKPKAASELKPVLFSRLGFRFGKSSVHTARTMMLQELVSLLTCVADPEAEKEDYQRAVTEANCLSKRSSKTRTLTFGHLADLYSLDRESLIFRTLLFFWNRDIPGRPLLALLCSYARDTILQSTASFILGVPETSTVSRQSLEEVIDRLEPGRFSKATLKSTAQNVNSTWTQSGHLKGRAKKVRTLASPTAGSAAYALLLAYLTGARGQGLFEDEYTRLLDCSPEKIIELAEEASRRGWLVFKRIGDVVEVLFPNLIGPEEMEWLSEQN